MFRPATFLLVLLSTGTAIAQSPPPIDSIHATIMARSVHVKDAERPALDRAFRTCAAGANTDEQRIRCVMQTLERLGDVHSTLMWQGRQYGNHPTFDDATLERLVPLVQRSQQETGILRTMMLEDRFGYIQVPTILAWGERTSAVAQDLSDSLCALLEGGAKGCIIDLRLNGGGQLSSMVSGLGALLGNGELGSAIDREGTVVHRFDLSEGNFRIDANPMTALERPCAVQADDLPVVLLTGPVTRSSGSILALLFEQRPNTWSIGEPTADGHTTGNDHFQFGPDLGMELSTAYNRDRSGKVYTTTVDPDVIVFEPDHFDDPTADAKVRMAVEWLRQQLR